MVGVPSADERGVSKRYESFQFIRQNQPRELCAVVECVRSMVYDKESFRHRAPILDPFLT